MRRLVFFAGPLLTAAFVFACEDDSSGPPSNDFPEAGAFDSSRPTSDSSLPDAGQPEADAVAPQPVTVVATGVTGAAVTNLTVVFHDANGAVLETKKTGADGKATSAVNPAIAMATVVFDTGASRREILTWTGVQGGDVLPVVAPVANTIAEFQITIPGGAFTDAGGPTSNYYVKVGGCETYRGFLDGQPVSVYVEPSCYRGMGAVLVAGANANDTIVAHALKKPVAAVADGGVVPVTTDAWKFPPADVTVSVTNTTDASGRIWFQQIANQTAFVESRNMGQAFDAQFKAAAGFADGYNAAVSYTSGFQASRVIGKRVAPTGTITLDASPAQLPPALTAATLNAAAPRRPVMSWTGNMGPMKGGLVRIGWFDGSTESTTRWSIVVPANNAPTGTVTAPALPADLDALLPLADGGGSSWETVPDVSFMDSDVVPDYATWRKVQGVVFPASIAQNGNVDQAVLPQNGAFRVTSFHPVFD
jgi:hypothetical protein